MTNFNNLLTEAMRGAPRFGHREHVHLTWLSVRREGTTTAIDLVSDGIRETSRYAGAPQKYHATVSRAWVECVGHHAEHDSVHDFDEFVHHNLALRAIGRTRVAAMERYAAPGDQRYERPSTPQRRHSL